MHAWLSHIELIIEHEFCLMLAIYSQVAIQKLDYSYSYLEDKYY